MGNDVREFHFSQDDFNQVRNVLYKVAGIKLADSRLLRAERSQQAKVLNFCFTGFAGQSMLLLGLAMITFWDSSFLPQGAACGSWENNLCAIIQKDALEELTWMLSSGGQVAFIVIWARSRKIGSRGFRRWRPCALYLSGYSRTTIAYCGERSTKLGAP